MATLLAIETSSTVCSVAISIDGQPIAVKSSTEKNAHSKTLTVMILDLMKENLSSNKQVDAVAVSKGPGSYTGLRIGVSVAKGLCYGWNKPLIAVDTIKAYAAEYRANQKEIVTNNRDVLLCPMLDARRMEVYTALYNLNLSEMLPVQALIVNENSFEEYLKNNKIIFFGNGAEKCREVIKSEHAVFENDFSPSASGISFLAEECFQKNQFVDTAYFEPYYMKEFIAGVPSKKMF